MQPIRTHFSSFSQVFPILAAGMIALNASAAAGLLAESGFARDSLHDEPQPIELDGSLEFTLMVGVWNPRLGGDVTLGGDTVSTPGLQSGGENLSSGAAGMRFELGPDMRLDSTERTVLPELAVRKRDIWEMHLSGFHFSTTSRGAIERGGRFGDLQFSAGDAMRSDFDITSAAGELRIGMYRAYAGDLADNRTSGGDRKVDFRFAPVFGVRYVEVEHFIERIGGKSERTGGTWLVPYAGLRFELTYFPDGALPVIRMLRLEAGGAMGPALGADGGFAWQVRAGLTCNLTDNLGVMFGYRLLELEVENNQYELNGGLQGLFIAGSLRF